MPESDVKTLVPLVPLTTIAGHLTQHAPPVETVMMSGLAGRDELTTSRACVALETGVPSLRQLALMRIARACVAEVCVVRLTVTQILLLNLITVRPTMPPALARLQSRWRRYTADLWHHPEIFEVDPHMVESPYARQIASGVLDSVVAASNAMSNATSNAAYDWQPLFDFVAKAVDAASFRYEVPRPNQFPLDVVCPEGVAYALLHAVIDYLNTRVDWRIVACTVATRHMRALPDDVKDSFTQLVLQHGDYLQVRHADTSVPWS
jgi:hypothetical protein